jgi:hypothetical protein
MAAVAWLEIVKCSYHRYPMSAPSLGIAACTCSALTFNARLGRINLVTRDPITARVAKEGPRYRTLDRSTIKHASQITALAAMMVAAQTAKTPTL